jgi:FimV-like protein
LDFKLDAVPEKPASAAISFDIPSAPVTSTVHQNDPLVQSFPELTETDEVVLNLELAEQYIQLGAYDAAREILTEKEADYSPQQRTHVDQLLNRIAS